MVYPNGLALIICTFIAAPLTAVCASASTSASTTTATPAHATMRESEALADVAHRKTEAARPEEPTEVKRTLFGNRALATVMGWPSAGGYLVLSCDGVELDFLGLDRFEELSRSTDPAEEDAHCKRMRKLGSKWWASEWQEGRYEIGRSLQDQLEDDVKVFGWPSSGEGVWALYLNADDATERGVGKIFNTRTMDERCEWIERLGGTFYANPDDCTHLDLHGKLEYNTTAAAMSQCS